MEWCPAGWSACLFLLIFTLHHKVQKFSSGTSSPGWSRKKGRKTVTVCVLVKITYCRQLMKGRLWWDAEFGRLSSGEPRNFANRSAELCKFFREELCTLLISRQKLKLQANYAVIRYMILPNNIMPLFLRAFVIWCLIGDIVQSLPVIKHILTFVQNCFTRWT